MVIVTKLRVHTSKVARWSVVQIRPSCLCMLSIRRFTELLKFDSKGSEEMEWISEAISHCHFRYSSTFFLFDNVNECAKLVVQLVRTFCRQSLLYSQEQFKPSPVDYYWCDRYNLHWYNYAFALQAGANMTNQRWRSSSPGRAFKYISIDRVSVLQKSSPSNRSQFWMWFLCHWSKSYGLFYFVNDNWRRQLGHSHARENADLFVGYLDFSFWY